MSPGLLAPRWCCFAPPGLLGGVGWLWALEGALLSQLWAHGRLALGLHSRTSPHSRPSLSVVSDVSPGRHPQEEMTSALATMRVDYEQIKIKKIEDASNPLLLKRRKKARALEAAALAH